LKELKRTEVYSWLGKREVINSKMGLRRTEIHTAPLGWKSTLISLMTLVIVLIVNVVYRR
jgi:hypothetical protein